MRSDTPEDPPDDGFDLHTLLGTCARVLAKNPEPASFLDWIAEAGPQLAPAIATRIDPRTGPVGLAFRALGVAIYGAMPQPEAGFRPRKLPNPGRNEPCYCGSGRKYKQCCLPLAGQLDLGQFNMLRFVLDELPARRFVELPRSRVEVLAVADTAMQWHDEERIDRAIALLEPWFAGDGPLGVALDPVFDELMECYLTLGNERKRDRLVEQCVARGDPALRASALQRRSAMQADRGDLEGAWQSFHAAQRADPDNPDHATLEMTLLVSRGEIEQARARARFWIARLERMRDRQLDDLIEFLHEVADDPRAAIARIERGQYDGLDEFARLCAEAPAPAAHYTVRRHGEAGCELVADGELREIEQRWREVYLEPKPPLTAVQSDSDQMWDEPDSWLDFLARNPLAWQSFDVLDDVVLAAEVLPTMSAGEEMLDRLLERGAALLDINCAAANVPDLTLPWNWMKNRPALRLLAHLAFRALEDAHDGAPDSRALAPGETLLALNPADNHGIREPLTRAWLERDRAAEVVALTERFPDDFSSASLNRLLALHRLGRKDEALALLGDLAADHHLAIDMLLAKKPRKPKPDSGFGLTVGGEEEAWLYRESCRSLWERDGALDWLRASWAGLRRA